MRMIKRVIQKRKTTLLSFASPRTNFAAITAGENIPNCALFPIDTSILFVCLMAKLGDGENAAARISKQAVINNLRKADILVDNNYYPNPEVQIMMTA